MKKIDVELQREAKEYRETLYRQSPGVKRFVKAKGIVIAVLSCLLILHLALEIILTGQGMVESGMLVSELRKTLFHLVLLWVAWMGTWKASLLLYLIAVPSAAVIVLYWSDVIWAVAAVGPLLAALAVCELIYSAGIVLAAVWLTLFPQSRENAARARQIRMDYLEYINEHMK